MPIFVGTGSPDTIVGSAEADTINGEGGNDILFGLAGDDSLNGGAGDDSLIGGAGNDTTNGGAGNDTHYVNNNGDVIVEAAGGGTDTVLASASYALTLGAAVEVLGYRATPTDTTAAPSGASNTTAVVDVNLTGNEFAQTINGTAGANVLVGGRNADPTTGDTLIGYNGDDTFVVTNANDLIYGGAFNVASATDGIDTVFVSVADLEAQGQAVATYTLAANSSIEVLSAQNQSGTENLRLTGSAAGGETVIGNFGANTLSGGGGGDTLIGLDGNDTYLLTNPGDVILQETAGNDTVNFQAGAGASFSFLTAGSGAMANLAVETINLGGATVNVTGSNVAQVINGTAASETLNGAGGVDTLVGGGGSDTYVVDVDGEVITEAQAADTDVLIFNGTTGGFNLAEGVDVEIMAVGDSTTGARLGSSGDINGAAAGTPGVYLVGNSLAQTIFGGGGNDILNGDRGATGAADVLVGGAGNDIYRVYGQDDQVHEFAFDSTGALLGGVPSNAGGNDIVYTSADYSLATNVANIGGTVGGAGDYVETLSAADQSSTTGLNLTGSGIANKIIGAQGNDTLDGGGGGVDTLQGLGGNDTYTIRNTGDVILEAVGGGTDTVNLGAVGVTMTSYTLNAGAEVEVINLGGTVTSATGNSFAQVINGARNSDGTALAVNETISGGGGADTLRGGGGNDLYLVGNPEVVLQDTLGDNGVYYTSNTGGINVGNAVTVSTIRAQNADGTLTTGDVYLVGNNQAQEIFGNTGNNILNGAGGLTSDGRGDTLSGGAGDDIYRVFSSNFSGSKTASGQGDQIIETVNAGTDTVYTSANYVLQANVENLIAADQNFQTNLTLVGNTLNNSISGSAGNNVLVGSTGRDFLTGLGGADTFHFAEMGVDDADTIQDFFAGQGDKISLDVGVFTGFGASIDGSEFQLGTVATGNQATILYDQATGRLFYDADGAGTGSDAVLFAQLTPGTGLAADDFLLTPANTIPTPQP
ncbi:calcium-binding protein [Altererythrobacter sp. TH136]|uniref:calcium-binding protein n=1 Tax=Altererythrobacter sp. TH136 TaxID=2067415 RepID=UPI001165B119|nr:calcium-binding protein [Altererythrobacter sp. TH136]QDM41011.1 calcium-binding protein [Altererythrobacter sp. TH136]